MYRTLNSAVAVLLATGGFLTQSVVESKAVFAHYMVGTVDESTDHAARDIDGAAGVGFDAFALNVGQPSAEWAVSTAQQLFDYAGGKEFKLFFSFDFYQSTSFDEHKKLYAQFKDHPAYLRYGDADLPVVSSYSGGAEGANAWRQFKEANDVYLLPNPEAAPNYYQQPETFFQNWGFVDGVFSWEPTWPDATKGDETYANVSSTRDEAVKAAADAAGKAYMMGLSPLQYKDCCGGGWYRAGETTLPERMEQILSIKPEFTEVLTWNDAGESHYIGPCWEEGLTEEILKYGNSETVPHDAWQPLITSFINAFKAGDDASAMTPAGGEFTGAMWYHTVTKDCSGEKLSMDEGLNGVLDTVNYAVVLPAGSDGMQIRVSSNGKELGTKPVAGGLNYNSVAGMVAGPQKMELLDGSGKVVASAESANDVSSEGKDGFCNLNYYVAGLK